MEKDYPKPEDVKKNLENLPFITLTLENKHNKYWNYYNVAEKQLNRQNAELRKLTNILQIIMRRTFTDKVIEQYDLKPLQVNYNKNEIDLMIKSSDSYCELRSRNLINKISHRKNQRNSRIYFWLEIPSKRFHHNASYNKWTDKRMTEKVKASFLNWSELNYPVRLQFYMN